MKENRNGVKQMKIKQEIKSLVQSQQTEPSTGMSTFRSGLISEGDGKQMHTDRSYGRRRQSTALRKFSVNSTIDKNTIQNIINPLIIKKKALLADNLMANMPINKFQANNYASHQISPASTSNQSINLYGIFKQPTDKNNISEDKEKKVNLTKNTYHQYLQNELNDQESRLINDTNFYEMNGNKMSIDLAKTIINDEPKPNMNFTTERNENIQIQNIDQGEQQYGNSISKMKTSSYHEDSRYLSYQNKLLSYSQSKMTFPKVNPDYFTLAQQVCKNQTLMHSRRKSWVTVSPGRKSQQQSDLEDAADTYKQTVHKLVFDRQQLNRTKHTFSHFSNPKVKVEDHQQSIFVNQPHIKQTNILARQQRLQQFNERQYFSSLFEDQSDNRPNSLKSKILSLKPDCKIDHKSDNMNHNKIKKQKLKDFLDIQKLSQNLIKKGLIKSEESQMLDTKLKIQKFFLKKDVSYQHKKDSFKKLMKEFNPLNTNHPSLNAIEITQMLESMKPFYFDKSNNPSRQEGSMIERLGKKGFQTSSSYCISDQRLTSQATTFYKTKGNQDYQFSRNNSINKTNLKIKSQDSNNSTKHHINIKC